MKGAETLRDPFASAGLVLDQPISDHQVPKAGVRIFCVSADDFVDQCDYMEMKRALAASLMDLES